MRKIKITWHCYKWFLIFWLLVNIVQSYFTNLHYDEAYYWLYSQNLAWGYFDHPPMVSIFAKMGDLISHSPLGLRLSSIFFSVFILLGIFHLINDNKNYKKVILFTISFPLITTHIAGFFIIPDSPLVLFFILYLISYRNYLKNDNTKNTIVFSLIIAAMFYSKYHAGIVIILTILSNIKLLKKYSFWLAGAISIILLIPHIIWQYNNDFISFLYHFSDRGSGFNINNFLHYVISQIILAGPLTGIIIIWLAYKYQYKNQFEKTLKYIAFGFYIFFLVYCFKGQVEAHWTSVSTIALIIISYKELINHHNLNKNIKYLLIPTVLLIFVGRVILANDYFDNKLNFKSYFIDMDKWSNEIDSISENKPILFTGQYYYQSIYSFSKNSIIPSSSQYNKRFSQVDLNKIDSIYNGKDVFALDLGNEKKWKSKYLNRNPRKGTTINDYYSYTGLKVDDVNIENINDSLFLSFKLINTTNNSFLFFKDNNQKLTLNINLDTSEYVFYFNDISINKKISSQQEKEFNIYISKYNNKKIFLVDIGLSSNGLRVYRDRKKTYLLNN